MFAIGLFAVNINQIITRAFYARKKARLPAILSAASLILNIIRILILIGRLGARGPALATSISGTALLISLCVFLRRDTGNLNIYCRKEWLKLIAATAAMSLFVFILAKTLSLMSVSYIMCAVMLAGIVVGAVVIYAGALIAMKSEVAVLVIGIVKSLMLQHGKEIEP
jgi:peptidoglycan biosynthesis protein MviN/MurJ (putative lipid II flippase)